MNPSVIQITLDIGPPGPVGPSGASGSYVVVTSSTSIPVGQIFTIVDATIVTTQTLPLISDVLTDGNLATTYYLYNVSGNDVTVIGSGSDQVQYGSSLIIPFAKESITLLPTTELGWIIV
jgi:hypothetical protein